MYELKRGKEELFDLYLNLLEIFPHPTQENLMFSAHLLILDKLKHL